MKNLTAKNAVINITVRIGGDIETFFLYSARSYSEVINAINHAQQTELTLKTGEK